MPGANEPARVTTQRAFPQLLLKKVGTGVAVRGTLTFMVASRRFVLSLSLMTMGVASCEDASPTRSKAVEPTSPTVVNPCPDEMALVTAESGQVCIDKYEEALDGWSYSQPLDGATPSAHPAKGKKPQVNVSEVEAEAACAGAEKRLCTETEWTSACRGKDHFTYPYGNDHNATACNEGKPSPVQRVLGTMGGRLDDPRLAETPDGIAPGGSFSKCVTSTGIFDVHGNVHEWVSTSPKPDDPRFGEFLGGFFADAEENGPGCTYKTTAHFKDYHDYSIGFRCCKDVTGK